MELQAELQRLSGTTLDAAGAANAWAGTTNLELVGALNAKAGTTGLELLGVLNRLAGTTGLEANAAAAAITRYSAIYLPGTSGNYVSAPDSAALTLADIDLRAKVAMDDWTPATTMVLLSKVTTNQQAWQCYINTTGTMSWVVSSNGTAYNLVNVASSVLGFANGSTSWLQCTYVAATGAWTISKSTDGISWAQLNAGTGTAGAVFDSSALLQIGANFNGAGNHLAGKVYYAEIRNGINGPVVATFNPAAQTVTGVRSPSSWTDPQGNIWTVNGSAWSWV